MLSGLSGLGSALVLSSFLLPDATALTAPSANQRRQLQNMARMAMTSPAGETYHMRPTTQPKPGPAEPAANFDSLNVVLERRVRQRHLGVHVGGPMLTESESRSWS